MKSVELDYQNGNIGKLFRSLFFPTLIGMLCNSVFLITDGIFVGQGIGPSGLAAVNMVAPIFILICGIALMFGIGSSVGTSICLANKQILPAKKIVFQCFISGELLILLLATIFISDSKGIVSILGGDDSIMNLSSAYLLWLFPAMICMLPQIGGMMVMRLDGSPRYAMFCQLIPAILNIALDYYLIFHLKLQTTGAALATSVSGIVGTLMVIFYFCKLSVNFRFTKITGGLEGILSNTQYSVKIGFSAFFTEATTCVMMLTGNYMFMRIIGVEGVSAYSIVCYLFPVFFSFANSIIQSEQPIISFSYGNQAYSRIATMLRQSIGTAFLSGIGLSLCCLLFNRPIAEIFLGNGLEYELAVAGIPLFAICPVFFISNMAMIGFYQSIEKAGIASIISILRGFVILVPSFIILPSLIGIAGLWLAIPMSELITLTVTAGIFLFRHRVGRLEKSLT